MRWITQFSCLINAFDTIPEKCADQEVKGVCDELLQPDKILFLLLLSFFLVHINRFSNFAKKKSNFGGSCKQIYKAEKIL